MKNHMFFLFILIGVTAAENEYVSFSGENVIITCDTVDKVSKDGVLQNESYFSEKYDDSNSNKYGCGDQKFKFFIKAKVCKDCYELDSPLVVGAICGDLLITGGVILLVFLYGQRKSGPAPQKPTNARRTAGSGGGPPVPSPDYQPLSDFNRSKDTYATVHKTG